MAIDLSPAVPVAAILGIVGQWGIGAFYAGRMDERLRGHGYEIRDLKDKTKDHDTQLGNHERRISHIEGRKGIPLGSE
jgi:hypothetical protein